MKTLYLFMIVLFAFCLTVPSAALAGKGYMGGSGSIVPPDPVVADEATGDSGGVPDSVEGPENDMMSDAGKLFGDLYVILRQQGVVGDKKLVPDPDFVDNEYSIDDHQPFLVAENTDIAPDTIVGGEPVLTVIDSMDNDSLADYGWYAAEIGVNPDETPIYGVAKSPFPAQCVQPVASYERWGDISLKTGLLKNSNTVVPPKDIAAASS